MLEGIKALFCRWTPWEEQLLASLTEKLGHKHQEVLRKQLEAVTKIQRIVGWAEIDLYTKNNWEGVPKFFDDREFSLALASTFVDDKRVQSEFFCVNGHLFSIESKMPVKHLAFRRDTRIEIFDVDKRFL